MIDLDASGFSTSKKNILTSLKRMGNPSLADLAAEVGLAKMTVLKHLQTLEGRGLVERSHLKQPRGRPRVHFKLAPSGDSIFPTAYAELTCGALEFIEERLGRGAVVEMLQQRADELVQRHQAELRSPELASRVRKLAVIRDEGGYMAEITAAGSEPFEMLEYNCPIIQIADRWQEACSVEREMFETLLKADVEVAHRVVAGDSVCRFLISSRN